jgi:glutathione synthase/RimK-type ligase-like ATP-grasp enzyme
MPRRATPIVGAAATLVAVSRIALCTWSDPSYVDPEPPAIADQLQACGHEADVVVWHDPAVDWGSFDLVVIRSTWDYFDRLDEYLEWADQVHAVSRIINSPKVIRWNSHKGYLLELGRAGMPVLPTLALPTGAADPVDRMVATGWGEVVIKPAVDGGARGALKAPAASVAAQEHLCALVAGADTIVQPYAPSVESGEVSLFFFGGTLSHAVRKVPKPGDYRVQALHGGSEEVHEPTGAELDLAVRAMALAPDELVYARVDLIDVDGRPTLMELELIEPDLFLRMAPGSTERFAAAVTAALAVGSGSKDHGTVTK